ncbi:hypothetical protein ACFYYH_22645 [Streptomyces sp. NPDC002018]|uniref:hypothetical protein n=1 Tax=Streptomyces sp. NPDC002018 TaxID=3364629 RepID=UPI0036C25175
MMNNAKIGVALVGGYVLGRTKKAKLAIGLGMFLAGKKLSLDPQQLGKLVANSPVLGSLNDQVRKELVGATKSAATSALTRRMNGLADSLHERTLDLQDHDDEGARAGRGREQEADEDEDEGRAAEKRDGAEDKTPASRGRAPARKTGSAAAKASSKARGAASGSARKTASPRGGKSASSGARKTASGAARKSSERGGGNG